MNRRIALIPILLLLAGVTARAARADQTIDQQKAAKVKSAYVLNFLRFTRWPDGTFEDEAQALVIAVVGKDTLRPILEKTVAGKRYDGREIVIRRFSAPSRRRFDDEAAYQRAVSKLQGRLKRCHVVYWSQDLLKRAKPYLNAVASQPILCIGETRAFAERGATLALGIDEGRVVFYANAEAIEASPLAVSSKLLRLARVIESEG